MKNKSSNQHEHFQSAMTGNMPGWAVSDIQTNRTAVSNDFEHKRLNAKNHFNKSHSKSLAIKGFMGKGDVHPPPKLSEREFSEPPACPVTTPPPPAGRRRPSVVLTRSQAALGSLRGSSGAAAGGKEQLYGGPFTPALSLSFSTLPFVFTMILLANSR